MRYKIKKLIHSICEFIAIGFAVGLTAITAMMILTIQACIVLMPVFVILVCLRYLGVV